MIKKITIQQYRKFKNQEFSFTPYVNLISGTNGTCKSSLLHIISNSFQAINRSTPWLNDKEFLKIFKGVNQQINPKVDNLAKGDKTYNDPALHHKGNLFGITYSINDEDNIIEFRRHNNTKNDARRYYLKPLYKAGASAKLPICPVVYLGLSRLLPFGEYEHEADLKASKICLPNVYLQESQALYQELTNLSIGSITTQKIGNVKTRSEFVSNIEGIDSNTISSGEDNLSIIVNALLSLKYYSDVIDKSTFDQYVKSDIKSVLLIDELDATLHPSVQNKLLSKLEEFSKKYGIQVFATTHSLSLLENALKHRHNVLYLVNNISTVKELSQLDIYKIKMHLSSQNKDEIYQSRAIPIYSEDEEARDLITCLFDYKADKDQNDKVKYGFYNVRRLFHLVQANLGADNLRSIFNDVYLKSSTIQAICILDGDKTSNKKDLTNRIIVLPGGCNPEELLKNHALRLYKDQVDDVFWNSDDLINAGFSKQNFLENILPDIDNISMSSSGVCDRQENKRFYQKHKYFLTFVFGDWLRRSYNQKAIEDFFRNLHTTYIKVAPLYGIDPNEWGGA